MLKINRERSGPLQRLFEIYPKDEKGPHLEAFGVKKIFKNHLVKSYKPYSFDI